MAWHGVIVGGLFSGAMLCLLAIRDPKRLRFARSMRTPWTLGQRRVIASLLVVPTIAVPVVDGSAGWVLWLFGTGCIGWLIAYFLAPRPRTPHEPKS